MSSKYLPDELDNKYAELWLKANRRELDMDAFHVLHEMAADGLISRAALRRAHEAEGYLKAGESKIPLGWVPNERKDRAVTITPLETLYDVLKKHPDILIAMAEHDVAFDLLELRRFIKAQPKEDIIHL